MREGALRFNFVPHSSASCLFQAERVVTAMISVEDDASIIDDWDWLKKSLLLPDGRAAEGDESMIVGETNAALFHALLYCDDLGASALSVLEVSQRCPMTMKNLQESS